MEPLKIVLPGGGVRCVYQVALLSKILKNKDIRKKYYVDKIYGTSFGALVGFFLAIDKIDVVLKFFKGLSQDSLPKCFNFYGYTTLKKIPLFGKLVTMLFNCVWILVAIRKKGLYTQKYGEKFLENNIKNTDPEKLERFNCCVYNITKGEIDIVNGSHPFIKEYILASASLWILFPPRKIRQLKIECVCTDQCDCNNTVISNKFEPCTCSNEHHKYNEFMDGGVIKRIPLVDNQHYGGKCLVLATKNIKSLSKWNTLVRNSGANLFEYLDNIITLLSDYVTSYDINHCLSWQDDNLLIVNYESVYEDAANVNESVINKIIQDGYDNSDTVIKDLLNQTVV